MLKKPLRFSHEILKDSIVQGDHVIDATVGNGNDTVLLAQLVGPYGKVYGFDIQMEAIQATEEKLILTGQKPQVELIEDGHQNMDQYLKEDKKISAVTFNLGYLPKGDKSITTKPETTLKAIKKSLQYLRRQGIVSVMVYSGHEGGLEEKDAIDSFVSELPQDEYNVLLYQFINQINNPPYLYIVEKK
ncbi:class I SAM-dependent methyltransferase [Carnobacteriaceae bacterium 52-44]